MADEKTPLLFSSGSNKPVEIGFEPKGSSSGSSGRKDAPQVPFGSLFRFVDSTDKALLVLAVMGSCFYGVVSPAQFIVFGSLTDDFVEHTLWILNITNSTEPDLEDSTTTIAYWYIGIAIANFGFAWMGLGLFGLVGQRQAYKMRLAMFRNVIYQEIGWFDEHSTGELNVNLSEQAADNGHAGGAYNLVAAHFQGFKTDLQEHEIENMLKVAADGGHEEAKRALREMYPESY